MVVHELGKDNKLKGNTQTESNIMKYIKARIIASLTEDCKR